MSESQIKDLARAMLRFHGEEAAIDLARHYSIRSMGQGDGDASERWAAVAIFLEEFSHQKHRFGLVDHRIRN